MSELVQKILAKRGIGIDQLTPYKKPMLNFPEMNKLIQDLKFTYFIQPQVITGILYDVDVDGLMAGSTLYDFLKRVRGHTFHLHTYINKQKRHGITEEVVQWVFENRIEYLFVVDAGSGDFEEYTRLAAAGVKVVILDHHPYEPQEKLPENVWIVNPITNPELPLLSGAGVVYRFIEGVARDLRNINVTMYEPLVGVSVLSDICSMTDNENRHYVKTLYERYDTIPLLKVLADKFYTGSFAGLFSYKIIPFLNAMIRIGQEQMAVEVVNNMFNLGKSKRTIYMQQSAVEIQKKMQDEIMEISKTIEKPNVVILLRAERPELSTLNGLVANKLREAYKKEALVLYVNPETREYKGSYRGYYGTIDDLRAHGIEAQGHPQACGVKMDQDALRSYANGYAPVESAATKRIADIDVEMDKLTSTDLYEIAKFNEMTGKDLEQIVLNLSGGYRSIQEQIQEQNRRILKASDNIIIQFLNKDYSENYITFTPVLSKYQREGYQLIRV